jgi:hypothetical protein
MKKLNEKAKILINTFIDGELDTKHLYSVKKLIDTDKNAYNFYNEMVSLKRKISSRSEIKASDNFEFELKNKIHELKYKKDWFSAFYKLFSWFSFQHLTYASVSLVFLFFFGFGVYHVFIPKKSAVPQGTGYALSSPIPSSEAESAPAASSGIARAKAKSMPRATTRSNSETNNQREARELFDAFERRSGSSVAVQTKINKGVEEFYNRNWNKSRIYFRSVMQSANRSSVHYKIARDYLNRMPQQ